MIKVILYALLFYFLYRFIVDLVIPVGKASKQVRSKIKEMQDQQFAQQQQFRQQQEQDIKKEAEKPVEKEKEYIEFEEIR